jgi:AbrB family looped-hinge helix DNA binding protein
MEIAKLSSKGQIVLPMKIREELDLQEGSILAVDIMKELIIIKKINVDLVNQFNKSLDDVKKGKVKRVA